jgi:hypothetical protein
MSTLEVHLASTTVHAVPPCRSKFGRFLDSHGLAEDAVAKLVALEDRYVAQATETVRGWAAGTEPIEEIEMRYVAIAVSVLLAEPVSPIWLFDSYRVPPTSTRLGLSLSRERLRRSFFNRAADLALAGEIELRVAYAD